MKMFPDESTDTPVVFVGTSDPVGSSLVASLARPGGTATGFSALDDGGLVGKRLQIFTEAIPGVNRVAVIWNPKVSYPAVSAWVLSAGASLGIEVDFVDLASPQDVSAAARAAAQGARGLFVVRDFVTESVADQIISHSTAVRLPTIFADMRRNWPRSRQTSSSLRLAPQRRRPCYRRPAPCRSCL